MKIMKKTSVLLSFVLALSLFAGCTEKTTEIQDSSSSSLVVVNSSENTYTDMYTERDMETGYDSDNCTVINLSDSRISSDESVVIKDSTATLTKEGVYLIQGEIKNGQIIVDASEQAKIQLVLNNAIIENDENAPIYIKSADKVFITTDNSSKNMLSVKNEIKTDGDNKIDAVIFSKSDLTLNGNGSLTISSTANGITSKDDLVITSGRYEIDAQGHCLEGKDSVRINDGTFVLNSGKDGIHSENSDDAALGFVFISGGKITVNSKDDGIHSSSTLTIENGDINIENSVEGIEGQKVLINGGTVNINSSDDGINAATPASDTSSGQNAIGGKVNKGMFQNDENAFIKITGGKIIVNAGGDGIDSNGSLYITGGETYVIGPVNGGNGSLDYNGNAEINGGTFFAAGTADMAQNFGSSSLQGSLKVISDATQFGDVTLKDESGNVIMTVSPSINYNCVVISTPKIEKDKTYTLTMGTETKTITMTELVMSEGTNQRGNPTGMGKGERPKNGGLQQNGIPAFPNGTPPEGFPSMDENEAEKNKPKPTDIPQQS